MRWKAQQFLGKLVSSKKETYGLKSRKYPQTIDELIGFEDSLSSLTINIEFSNVSNTFQEQLANDIKQIKYTNKVIVPADKAGNLYKVEKEDYKKYSRYNITKTYKKSSKQKSKVNRREFAPKKIADKLLISDRIDQLQKNDAYITVKDHKESFPHNPSFRLTNSSKTDIGKISETLLD